MKQKFLHSLLKIFLAYSGLLIQVQGQPPAPRVLTPEETASVERRVKEITSKAEKSFKMGLLSLKDNKRPQARTDFDRSIEAFLLSGINVRTHGKLQGCYSEIIETIYRMEFPSTQNPEVKRLFKTCDWNLDNEYAEIAEQLLQMPISAKPLADVTANANVDVTLVPQLGLQNQVFEISPIDTLAKLEIEPDDRIRSRVVIPKKNTQSSYVRVNPYVIVRAMAGDTIKTIAARYKVNVVELAKFNGLLPDSSLTVGREVRLPQPASQRIGASNSSKFKDTGEEKVLGAKPVQFKDGKVKAVMDYFNENFHDPYSMRFVKWSAVNKAIKNNQPYWSVTVKYRAKNIYGAYVLSERIFYVRKNKVISWTEL